MKKALLILTSALALLLLSSCNKPGSDTPDTPGKGAKITSNNAAPGGFTDEGTQDWDK